MPKMNRNREHKRRLRERVIAWKHQQGCKFCGEHDACCLDAHHRNRHEKEHAISTLVSAGCSYERLDAELAKCDCICANCHRKLEYSLRKAGVERDKKQAAILPGMWENKRRVYVQRDPPDTPSASLF